MKRPSAQASSSTTTASGSFVDALYGPERAIEAVVKIDPQRAVRLYETFLAGCYEKANELDDSSGGFGMFVNDLYAGWIKARQEAGFMGGFERLVLGEGSRNDLSFLQRAKSGWASRGTP